MIRSGRLGSDSIFERTFLEFARYDEGNTEPLPLSRR